MMIGFDLTRLDDGTIHAMRKNLRTNGVDMRVVARENDRYLCLDARDYTTGKELIDLARHYYKKMKLEVVVWDDEMGEFISEARFRARAGLSEEMDEFRDERDVMGGDYKREHY